MRAQLERKTFNLLANPNLTYVHELWEVTKMMKSWIQVAKMIFLHRLSGSF